MMNLKNEGLKLCSQLKLQYQVKKYLKALKKDLGSFCNQYGIEMSLSPSHKTRHNIRKSQPHQKKKYKKDTNYKKQNNTSKTKPKKEVKCFKCGKKGHIASNGKKNIKLMLFLMINII